MPIGSTRIRAIVTAATPLAARQLSRDLAGDSSLQITAVSSVAALFDQITLARPNVILLDTQLAGENTPQLVQGLTQQRQIAVALRTDSHDRSSLLLDSLDRGALAITTKPSSIGQTAETTPNLIWTLHAAAGASIQNLIAPTEFEKVTGSTSSSILALAAGMGGLAALTGVLAQLPNDAPAGIAVTGLPGYLTAAWVDRIASRCSVRIKQAVDGDTLRPGQILIAPGDSHTLIRRGPGGWTTAVKAGPAVFHQKPSIEVLFNSLVETTGQSTVAAVFSGAGVDGVAGMLSLRKAGGRTIAESPSISVCSDLPTRAQRCGSAEITLPANQIAQKMLEFAAQIQLPRAA
jgi:two-component system chemotaxis response regulator CheB